MMTFPLGNSNVFSLKLLSAAALWVLEGSLSGIGLDHEMVLELVYWAVVRPAPQDTPHRFREVLKGLAQGGARSFGVFLAQGGL